MEGQRITHPAHCSGRACSESWIAVSLRTEIYHETGALRTLEYTKIIERLTELAGSSIGKELCRNLKPSSNLAEIEAAQKQTSDALSRIYQRGSISFSGVQDVRGSLKRLEIGGSLSALELLRIAKLLETTG